MKAEIGDLYASLDTLTRGKSNTRDWAAMQALQTRINSDPELEALIEKHGLNAVVAAVVGQVQIFNTTDGFSPHVLIPTLKFAVVEQASVIMLSNNK